MVKGISKRVIMIKPPVGAMFEQAIFIVKDEAVSATGIDSDKILNEAIRIANGYLNRRSRKRFPGFTTVVSAVSGASAVGLIWLVSALLIH